MRAVGRDIGVEKNIYVNGEFRPARTNRFVPVVNPATEDQIGTVAESGEADVQQAVEAARVALGQWRDTPVEERCRYLRALAEQYDQRSEQMAALVTEQNGTVIAQSRITNGTAPVHAYRHFAGLAGSWSAERITVAGAGASLVRREPVGVAGVIIPWNAPQILLANKMAPALLAGCTVVVKPSPETSLDALMLAQMITEAGFPPGVINIVTGGPDTGKAIVRNPGIDKISFTGSTGAGRTIAATCGELLKPVAAELGGKSAAIVLEDADLDVFAAQVVPTCLPNTGQICYACARVLAPATHFAEVVDLVVGVLGSVLVGDPMDPASTFGPLVSARQRDRVEGYIASGRAEGARIVLGGGRPADHPMGYYVEPTVFTEVEPWMRICREEIFGPVLVVMAYQNDEDAVRMANDSDYGLGGAVFSSDQEHALEIARRLETGNVHINGLPRAQGAFFGGVKNSGMGGDDGVAGFLHTKGISVPA